MIISEIIYNIKDFEYVIRSAKKDDALQLSQTRVEIDGETENMDRESGEDFMNSEDFQRLIKEDSEHPKKLFLVVCVNGKIVGFSRCVGSSLSRIIHKAEFGICVLKKYWGFGIGKNLLKTNLEWADGNGIRKINLSVIETNIRAINLYFAFDFEVEGVLKFDKLLSDGKFYNTLVMGRIHNG